MVPTLPPDVYEVLHQTLTNSEPKCPKLINTIEGADWRAPIITFLKGHYEPNSKEENSRLHQIVRGYKIIMDNLFKTSVTSPLLKCVTTSEGNQKLKEIHEGTYGSHNKPRTLVGKGFRQVRAASMSPLTPIGLALRQPSSTHHGPCKGGPWTSSDRYQQH
jgi:hypothetical protein